MVLVWFALQLFTPVRGLLAFVLALLVSTVFSIIFLGKQRDAMSESMFGFFRGLNARIDAAAAKEDHLDENLDAEPNAQHDPVDQQQIPGDFEDGNQSRP